MIPSKMLSIHQPFKWIDSSYILSAILPNFNETDYITYIQLYIYDYFFIMNKINEKQITFWTNHIPNRTNSHLLTYPNFSSYVLNACNYVHVWGKRISEVHANK